MKIDSMLHSSGGYVAKGILLCKATLSKRFVMLMSPVLLMEKEVFVCANLLEKLAEHKAELHRSTIVGLG